MARKRLAALAAAAAVFALLCWQLHVVSAQGVLFGDFHAFYCGASALLHGENPYLAAPIMLCESAAQPFGLYSAQAGLAEPVPFPGYAFVLFAPFALLPYVPAALAWLAFIVASGYSAASMLARMAAAPFAGVMAIFGMGFAVAVWPLGELAGVAVCALVFAAMSLRESRTRAAAIALCAGAVLPHVVAPAIVAAFFWEKRARVALAAGVAALILLDLAIGGPKFALSYFQQVLPAHAQSEIGYVSQYGLSWILHATGASDRIALVCGNLSYAAMVLAGVAAGGALARKYSEPAFLVLVPPAFAVTGGAFMHYTEIMAALPAAVLLFVRSSGRVRDCCLGAILLLAIPWQWLLQAPLIVPAVVSVFAIGVLYLRLSALQSVRAAAYAALFCCVLFAVALHFGPQVAAAANSTHIDSQLAQASWASYIRSRAVSGGTVWWVAKAPTWIGLALLALGCAASLAQKNFEPAFAVERAPVRT